MKYWRILLICLALFVNKAYSQNYLNQTYDIDGYSDTGFEITPLQDGNNLLFVGSICEDDLYCNSLVKVKPNGEIIWQKTFTNYPNQLIEANLVELEDGNLLVFGEKTTFNSQLQMYLWKLNSDGEIIWQKSFGGKENDYGRAIIRNFKNEIILFGYSNAYSDADGGIFMRKINEEGEEIWHHDLGTEGVLEDCFCPHEDKDGGYTIGLKNVDTNTGRSYASAMKVDSVGQIIWHRDMEDIGNYFNVCLAPHPLGGYWFTAQRNIQLVDNQAKPHQLLLAQLDSIGNTIQEIYFADTFPKIAYPYLLNNGDILLYGYDEDPEVLTRYFSAWLARVNPQGEILWERNYTYDNVQRESGTLFFDVHEETTGSILLTGRVLDIDTVWINNETSNDSTFYINRNSNAWLFRVTADGCIPGEEICEEAMFVNIEEEMLPKVDEIMKVYPNPTNSQTNIIIENINLHTTLSVHDLTGHKVYQFPLVKGQNRLELDTANLHAGLYFLLLETKGRILARNKLVVEK